MTIAAGDIAKYSIYEVKDGGAFPTTLYDEYKLTAAALLDQMKPSNLDAQTYDYCHALLVCHLYAMKLGTIEIRSTAPERWEFINPGDTGFMIQVRAVLKAFVSKQENIDTDDTYETDSRRVDYDMEEMHLDQASVPVYEEE